MIFSNRYSPDISQVTRVWLFKSCGGMVFWYPPDFKRNRTQEETIMEDLNLEEFENMDEKQLRDYIRFLLFNYRVMDAFWFIRITEHFDLTKAEQINEEVWNRVADFAGRDLMKSFDYKNQGLKGFVKAMKLFPWCILVGYDFEEKEDEVLISVKECPAQAARLKRGLGEYVCKHMHMKEFTSFIKHVDERIVTECVFAPPDPHPEDMHCKWRFTLKE